MSQVNTKELLKQLYDQSVQMQQQAAGYFDGKTAALLQQPPAPGKWSALQCLEHLNSYGRYYLPALEKVITTAASKGSQPATHFKSSWLGAYFIRLMQPNTDQTLRSKMQSPRDHVPPVQLSADTVIAEFIQQQTRMQALLQRAAKINIRQAKVPTSISRFIKLSVGDTFGFLTAHTHRHMLQAARAARA
ncbi:DinB family protein [Chitinophaga nivalis]|uniref:DinB family protein n=1 Tax=Chitinophaga nivalis TaxID=2991709 RepID=A0ABT3IVA7_9BACT|nr:DinB family protein [Chitinophaga nivalis]MCW3462695.1 DinB family protein [Chitinophaga nivalis]MCW3487614.1 DinB family protein [Chitinophaga nivalis]